MKKLIWKNVGVKRPQFPYVNVVWTRSPPPPSWMGGGSHAICYTAFLWVCLIWKQEFGVNRQTDRLQWRIQDLVEGGGGWIVIDKGEALVRGTKCRAGGGGGGRVREGGVPPPHLEENGNQEMLRGLLKHTKIRIL